MLNKGQHEKRSKEVGPVPVKNVSGGYLHKNMYNVGVKGCCRPGVSWGGRDAVIGMHF